jgi:hypothetical protein
VWRNCVNMKPLGVVSALVVVWSLLLAPGGRG